MSNAYLLWSGPDYYAASAPMDLKLGFYAPDDHDAIVFAVQNLPPSNDYECANWATLTRITDAPDLEVIVAWVRQNPWEKDSSWELDAWHVKEDARRRGVS